MLRCVVCVLPSFVLGLMEGLVGGIGGGETADADCVA